VDFSEALAAVKGGATATRTGWNGRGMGIFLIPGRRVDVTWQTLVGQCNPDLIGTQVPHLSHIAMRTAHGEIVPWLASQTDLLAEDWELAVAPTGSEVA
jgi:hypothetical protein